MQEKKCHNNNKKGYNLTTFATVYNLLHLYIKYNKVHLSVLGGKVHNLF